ARSRTEGEFEISDTGILAEDRFFDIAIEYAKADPYDILIRVTATNCGPEPGTLHVLPTIWFRNTWSWGRDNRIPTLQERTRSQIDAEHHTLGLYQLHCPEAERLLFTDN